MKKKWMAGALCLMLLSGCSLQETSSNSTAERYKALYEDLLEETSFQTKPEHYSLSLEMASLPDETYRYYVVIDSPQTPMYDVTALVVENDTGYGESTKMMPSAGIFDAPGSLVPGEVDKDKGCVKGIALSGESKKAEIDLRILVSYQNADHNDCTDTFHVRLSPEGSENIKGENAS